jgi:hypothetical protein
LRANSEVRILVQRAITGAFPVLIIAILVSAAYAGQVPAGLVLLAALILLIQARDTAPPDLLPGAGPLPHWRRVAVDRDIDSALAYFAAAPKVRDTAERESTRTGRVARQCAAELDAYQASLPGYGDWDWS